MKRITFITTKLNLVDGGGSNMCLDLKARYFLKNGWDVNVVTLNPKGNKISKDIPYNVVEEHNVKKSNLFVSKDIVNIFKKYELDTDIFHVDGHVYFLEAAYYRKKSNVPVVLFFNNYMPSVHAYNLDYAYSLKEKFFILLMDIFERLHIKRFSKYIDHAFYCSPVIQQLHEGIGMKIPATIIPDFFDIKYFSEKKLRGDKCKLLYVGRITYDKGIDILVEAFHKLEVENKYELTIVGSGNLQIINSGGVKVVEWQKPEDLNEFYKNSDVFVHPCRWPEPFGRTIVEAMAVGMPIITTEGGGAAWVAKDACIKFKNGSVDSLIENIKKISEEQGLYEKLSLNACQRALEFSGKKHAINLINTCGKLLHP